METKEKLKGKDYFNIPLSELAVHPDFSKHALRVVSAISEMTTEQLEKLNLIGGKVNAK